MLSPLYECYSIILCAESESAVKQVFFVGNLLHKLEIIAVFAGT